MKATVKDGVFTLVTPLTKKELNSIPKVQDEYGNDVYAASYVERSYAERGYADIGYAERGYTTNGSINPSYITCNTVIGGKAALTILIGEKTEAEVKESFGAAVVNAVKYLPILRVQLDKITADIESVFGADAE